MSKSSAKPSELPPNAVPQPHGGFLIPGKGGGPQPGSGRPPDEFKKMCQELACSAREAVVKALADDKHPAFIGALKWATEHGYGKPKETHDVNVSILSPEERKARIAQLLGQK